MTDTIHAMAVLAKRLKAEPEINPAFARAVGGAAHDLMERELAREKKLGSLKIKHPDDCGCDYCWLRREHGERNADGEA